MELRRRCRSEKKMRSEGGESHGPGTGTSCTRSRKKTAGTGTGERGEEILTMSIPRPHKGQGRSRRLPGDGQRPLPHHHRGMKGAGLALRAADSFSKDGGLASDLVVHTRW